MNRSTYSEFNFASRVRDPDGGQIESGDGLHEFFSTLSLYRLMIIGLAVMGLIMGVGYALTRNPIYQATAEIILSPGESVVSAAQREGGSQGPTNGIVESEIEILKSDGLVTFLVQEAGLDAARTWVQPPTKLGLLPAPKRAEMTETQVIDAIRRSLAVTRKETSYVLAISVTSHDPEHAATIANRLVDVYLISKTSHRMDLSRRDTDWLTTRIEGLKAEVSQKEAAVEAYRAEMDLLSVNGNTVAESQLSSIQSSLIEARSQYAESRARLEQMKRLRSSGGSVESISATLSSNVMAELRRREADVGSRRAELEQRYLPTHPDVQKVIKEQEEVRQQIDAEVTRIIANLDNEVEVAGIRVAELQRNQDQLELRLAGSNRDQVKLRSQQREAEAASNLLQQYLQLEQETAEESSRKVVDARPVSLAKALDEPVSPSPALWVAFFGVIGMFLGVVLAILRRALNNKLVRPEDVARKVGANALVSIPLVGKAEMSQCAPDERTPAGVVVARPMSRLAESVRILLSQILTDAADGPGIVIAVTSALAHEGKTTTALSLGRVAAMNGQRVLLIDGDLRMRSLSKIVAVSDGADLVSALRKNADWRTAIVADEATSAELLPAAPSGMVLGNLFASARMRTMLQEIRAEYDVIIIDCPPILAVADARTLSALADRTVLISHWNATPAPAVRTALREIENAGGKTIGVVLNQLKTSVVKRISYSDSLYLGSAGANYYTN